MHQFVPMCAVYIIKIEEFMLVGALLFWSSAVLSTMSSKLSKKLIVNDASFQNLIIHVDLVHIDLITVPQT